MWEFYLGCWFVGSGGVRIDAPPVLQLHASFMVAMIRKDWPGRVRFSQLVITFALPPLLQQNPRGAWYEACSQG